jgi:hypothetical protein
VPGTVAEDSFVIMSRDIWNQHFTALEMIHDAECCVGSKLMFVLDVTMEKLMKILLT